MHIKFNKTFPLEGEFEGFVDYDKEPILWKSDKYFFSRLEIRHSELKKKLIGDLNKGLIQRELESKVTSPYDLFVSGNNSFSLHYSYQTSQVGSSNFPHLKKKIGSQDKEITSLFSKRIETYPIIQYIPQIRINGYVRFEKLQGNDPTPILEVLNEQNYNAQVIPLSQELEKALENIERYVAQKRNSNKPITIENVPDDAAAIVALLAGIFLGTVVN